MESLILEHLENWLTRGGKRIGQILVRENCLLHFEDARRTDLQCFEGPWHARQLATYDDNGNFRPLKTAPNLRHGWVLHFKDNAELRLALDYFYPAALGIWIALEKGELSPVQLRQTLNRQSGVYALAKNISDPEADALVGRTCRSCLRQILWQIAPQYPVTPLQGHAPAQQTSIPLVCPEACNLLVAAARLTVKKEE